MSLKSHHYAIVNVETGLVVAFQKLQEEPEGVRIFCEEWSQSDRQLVSVLVSLPNSMYAK
jgi:hypothetical protein